MGPCRVFNEINPTLSPIKWGRFLQDRLNDRLIEDAKRDRKDRLGMGGRYGYGGSFFHPIEVDTHLMDALRKRKDDLATVRDCTHMLTVDGNAEVSYTSGKPTGSS